jgi:hypothetical protein
VAVVQVALITEAVEVLRRHRADRPLPRVARGRCGRTSSRAG